MTGVQNNRRHLRAATQARHARAESSWTKNGQFPTRGDYQGWLTALWSAHLTLGQAAAAACGGAQAAAAEQARINALRLDLAGPRETTKSRLPSTISWAFGVQYALNGSAIGAATLLKSGAIPPGWPTRYLQAMRDYASSGQLGRFFVELDQTVLHLPQATSGAAAVFDAITRSQPHR